MKDKQKQYDIGFIIHYSKVSRDRQNPDKRILKNYGWEPLLYVEGNLPDGRHTATIKFQRSEEASWPPIVKKRIDEFFEFACKLVNYYCCVYIIFIWDGRDVSRWKTNEIFRSVLLLLLS
jgi:hypothetical protein